MNKLISYIFTFFEKQSFGVCEYLAKKVGISTNRIRLFFIYLSFLSVGFPLIVYFFAAIVLDFRNYFRISREKMVD